MDVPKQDRMLPGSAHTETRVCLERCAGPFHPRVRSRKGLDIELQVAQIGRGGRWAGDSFFCRDEHARNLEALRKSDALDHHTARKCCGAGRAGQAQRATGKPAHTFRIADAHAVRSNVDVIAERGLYVIHAASEMQRSTARFSAYILKIQARCVENQVALHCAEPGWEIRGAGGTIFDMDAAGDAGAVQRSFERGVDPGHAPRVEFRHVAAEEPQVQSAVQAQSQRAAPRKLDGTSNLKIRVLALKSDGL